MSETTVREAFGKQAEWATRLDAPFSALLFETLGALIDHTSAVGQRVLDWPGNPVVDALVLRLAGGLHALVRAGALPSLAKLYPPNPTPAAEPLAAALASILADSSTSARLLPWLGSAPQTNEVGRSGVLMPGMLTIAAETRLPLRLFELGASAGLNLRMDAYAYRLGDTALPLPGAPLTLAPVWEGAPPRAGPVTIVSRRGVDLNPVDLCDPAARDRLLAYVWPEQLDRVARLEAAMAAFAADPAPLDRGDAAAWVASHVALQPGTATVVYHSIAWQYFPAATQGAITAHLTALGASATAAAPLAWLRYEFGAADRPPTLRLRLWPSGEDRLLADVHPHGASVRWLG